MRKNPIHHSPFTTKQSSCILHSAFCILFLCCCFYGRAQGPNYVWARGATGLNAGSTSEGFTIASDRQDNVFITGYYTGTTTFGPYTLTGGMPYLTKYDGSGNVLWVKDGTGYAINRALCTDALGNAYVAGTFLNTGTVTFGSHTLTCTAQQDLYAVGYDSSGNLKWAFNTIGTASSMQVAPSIAADAFGNAYLMGDFDAATLNIGTASVNAIGGEQVFLAKIDSSGNVLWARNSTGGVLQNALAGKCVATDNAGNIYVLGTMRGTSIKFGSITATGVTGTNIFLAKYDSSGNPIWAKAASATNINALETDPYDNSVYISGAYSGSAKFDTITLTNAGANTFIAKYDTAGTAIWAKSINGPNTVYAIAPNNGKVYISGKFTSTTSAAITLDTITITQPLNSTDPMWFAGYYSTGGCFFAQTLTSGGDDNNGIAASLGGCIYLGGDYQPVPFILGNDTLSSAGHESAFVAKLCYSGLLANFTSSDTTFCNESGKCINFYDQSTGNPTSWQWIFTGAQPDTSTQQNPTNICYYYPGTYPVTLIVSNGAGYDTLAVAPLIIFGTAPSPPTITSSGYTLCSSAGSSYQWYFNGAPIAGAISQCYTADSTGTYSVQVTNNIGCVGISGGQYVLITSVNELTDDNGELAVYPNPATDKLTIGCSLSTINCKLLIYNVLGEKVFAQPLNHPQTIIDVSSFSNGVYFLQLRSNNQTINKKFTVIH